MIYFRAFLLWGAIVPMAIANGAFRDAVLVRILGSVAARLCSGLILSVAIFVWTFLTISWLGHLPPSTYVAIGGFWLFLTVGFEFTFGRLVAKRTWAELLRAYRCAGGDIWPIVLFVVAVSPFVAATLRSHH